MPAVKIHISKEILEELYIRKNLTPFKIGEKLGCSLKTVRNRIREYGIPFKDPCYARMRYAKRDFDGSDQDKAYMLGFRLGDLNVYRPSEKSQTIVVRCHTTQKQQVDVIQLMFGKFGKITTSLTNGHFQVNCFLNNSFSFLCEKSDSVWKWIRFSAPLVCLSFIAGYVDAEGNFIINQGRARFKIDSYDYSILSWMSKWLKKNGIDNKFRIIYKKGEKVPNQSPFPKDLWRLNINKIDSLESFINSIMPLLKHKRRISQSKQSLLNISKRK